MKELQHFIEEYTNADSFFEESKPWEMETLNIELNVFDGVLVPNGMPRWFLRPFQDNPYLTRDEVIIISLEERLIHPIIAMQVMFKKIMEVFKALDNVLGAVGDQALKLWVSE